ncbi:Zinc knuckle CX2CX4HX4C [Sesbania bispinosa]|nr:Zinc knuckle CX2CX4HX4C [Sesbania bispinosa]
MEMEENNISQLNEDAVQNEITVELETEDLHSYQLARRSMIGKIFAGKPLNKGVVRSILTKAWGENRDIQVTDMGVNLFLFTFSDQKEVLEIKRKDPWYLMGSLMSLQSWLPQASVYELDFSKVSFWIQIHGIPLDMINTKNAAKIINRFGEVLEVENLEVEGRLLRTFIRVRALINVKNPLVTGVWVPRRDLPKVWIFFKYEKLQSLCFNCGVIGHDQEACSKMKVMSPLDCNIPKFSAKLSVPPAKSILSIAQEQGSWKNKGNSPKPSNSRNLSHDPGNNTDNTIPNQNVVSQNGEVAVQATHTDPGILDLAASESLGASAAGIPESTTHGPHMSTAPLSWWLQKRLLSLETHQRLRRRALICPALSHELDQLELSRWIGLEGNYTLPTVFGSTLLDFLEGFVFSGMVLYKSQSPTIAPTSFRLLWRIRERLDRVLVNWDWRVLYPHAMAMAIPATSSDHTPIIFWPKPKLRSGRKFKFELFWEEHGDCNSIIQQNWADQAEVSQGWERYFKKANNCKFALQNWHKSTFKRVDHQIAKLNEELSRILDSNSQELGNNWEQIQNLRKQIDALRKQESLYWAQRSRLKWLQYGDRNSKFFHASTVQRRDRNKLFRLKDSLGNWIEGQQEVENFVLDHYTEVYKSEGCEGVIECLQHVPTKVTTEMNESLLRPVLADEMTQSFLLNQRHGKFTKLTSSSTPFLKHQDRGLICLNQG